MRVIVLALAIAGCAAAPAPKSATPATEKSAALQERAAELFDAAMHHDRLRMRALVDWDRYRSIDLSFRDEDETVAARALAELEAEPHPSSHYVDVTLAEIERKLQRVASGPMPPRPKGDVVQMFHREQRPNMTPSARRLVTFAAQALEGHRDIYYQGSGAGTGTGYDAILVFVAGQLVAVADVGWAN
jgi:hypothetical protein